MSSVVTDKPNGLALKDASKHGYGLNVDELPKTQAEAIALGSRFFYTRRLCVRGHDSPRYTKASACVACNRVLNVKQHGLDESTAGSRARKHHARVAAHQAGENTYENPQPCKNGHYKRWVQTNNCIECDAEARHRHKVSAKYSRIKKEYGLSRDEYMAIVERQGGACLICGDTPDSHFSLHVDHCHSTKTVRGLLCSRCNQGIGLFRESKELLMKAMEYLS